MIEVHISVLIGIAVMAAAGGSAITLLWLGTRNERLHEEGWRVVPPPIGERPEPRRVVDLPEGAPRTRLRQMRVQNRQDLK